MALSDEIVKVLTEFGEKTVPDLQSSLKSRLTEKSNKYGTRRNSSSRLANSIKFNFTNRADALVFTISMADYGKFVDGGRNPGGVSEYGQKSIAEWSKKQGVAESYRKKDLETRLGRQSKSNRKNKKKLTKMPFDRAAKTIAFLVSRKLKKQGFEGNNFFRDIINDGRLDELNDKLREVIKNEIKIEILSELK